MKPQTKPVSSATRALLDEMQADAAPTTDKLESARELVRRLRGQEVEVTVLDERLSEAKRVVKEMKEKTIPDFFDEAGIPSLGLAAEGNMPALEIKIGDRYHANIPDETKTEAFAHLRKIGHEDLIKVSFTIDFGLREGKAADRFRRSLQKADIPYTEKCAVPWNTLTAWFEVQHRRKPLTAKAMALLGATVGRVAKIVKPKKEK